ncbi:hypothetical protein MP638_005658 [Amoeboaphelidium occidentale]|nr:hypothetical protein MP638_005658 [Amoeboaphelidium occidentale]
MRGADFLKMYRINPFDEEPSNVDIIKFLIKASFVLPFVCGVFGVFSGLSAVFSRNLATTIILPHNAEGQAVFGRDAALASRMQGLFSKTNFTTLFKYSDAEPLLNVTGTREIAKQIDFFSGGSFALKLAASVGKIAFKYRLTDLGSDAMLSVKAKDWDYNMAHYFPLNEGSGVINVRSVKFDSHHKPERSDVSLLVPVEYEFVLKSSSGNGSIAIIIERGEFVFPSNATVKQVIGTEFDQSVEGSLYVVANVSSAGNFKVAAYPILSQLPKHVLLSMAEGAWIGLMFEGYYGGLILLGAVVFYIIVALSYLVAKWCNGEQHKKESFAFSSKV